MTYDINSVMKSRLCSLIVGSTGVREAVDYHATDAAYPYDPEDPLTLVWNCVVPFLKDPDTITTTDTQILLGVDNKCNVVDPRTVHCDITIVVVVNYEAMKTGRSYIREDLVDDGIVCATRVDWIANEILKALSSKNSKTWIGDLQVIANEEYSLNNTSHYARRIDLAVDEVNVANLGV